MFLGIPNMVFDLAEAFSLEITSSRRILAEDANQRVSVN
jgi:hypothetical protein